jgi:hypothetical protein
MQKLVRKATQYIHSVANLIENPYLLAIKKGGGHPRLARFLNQPWIQSLNIATVLDICANYVAKRADILLRAAARLFCTA